MEIAKMLVLSTAHIKEETSLLLEREPNENRLGLSVYEKAEFGFWIYVPENLQEHFLDKEHLPADLWQCLELAHKNDCRWLCLDCDGPVEEELETYEW